MATSHETDLEETAGLVNLLDCNCLVMFYDYEWLAMTIHMDQYIHDMWMFHDVEQTNSILHQQAQGCYPWKPRIGFVFSSSLTKKGLFENRHPDPP